MLKTVLKRLMPRSAWRQLRRVGLALMEGFYRLLCWPWGWLPEGPQGGPMRLLLEKLEFTPEVVIRGYQQGLFPSPVHASGAMRWHDPDLRAVLPLDGLHVSRELRRIVRQGRFEIRFDTDFRGVVEGCAETKEGRETTWLTPEYIDIYVELHRLGVTHSVEAWQDGRLVGGGYGVAIGSYFSLESMFYRENQASKVAFVHLVEKLRAEGFTLIDCWWPTEHWLRFGVIPTPRNEFKRLLAHALIKPARFEPTVAQQPQDAPVAQD